MEKILGSEMNFVLTDCTARQSLMQPTQQQQPLRKKIVHLDPFRLSFHPVSCFGGPSCKQLHWRRLESLMWFIPKNYIANAGLSPPVKTVAHNFSMQLQTSLTHHFTHKAAARNKTYAQFFWHLTRTRSCILLFLFPEGMGCPMSPVSQGKKYPFAW